MMVLMLRCILYPNSELFITTGGKFILFLDRKYEHYLDFINNGSRYHKNNFAV